MHPTYRSPSVTSIRAMLYPHVGAKVEIRRAFIKKLGAPIVLLVGIQRTRATIQHLDAPMKVVVEKELIGTRERLKPEQWTVPIQWLVPPGCLESDQRQLPLFAEDAAP